MGRLGKAWGNGGKVRDIINLTNYLRGISLKIGEAGVLLEREKRNGPKQSHSHRQSG